MSTEPEWEWYADGTSGQQGDTSADTEEHRRQFIHPALALVREAGRVGLTCQEVEGLTGWHHGQASGALSNLHRNGRITRLSERRNHYGVYVTWDHVDGRETKAHRRNR